MRRLLAYFLMIFTLCCIVSCSHETKKKTVFIIVDGIPADVIERVHTPAIDEIASFGGYSRAMIGGEAGGLTESPTISAVGYNTLLTGTWTNKHNVWGNGIEQPNYNYWTLFRVAQTQKRAVTTAVYSTWLDNRVKLVGDEMTETGGFKVDYHLDGLEHDTILYPKEQDNYQIFRIDEKISEEAARCIKEDAPDLMWVYLQYTDDIGHQYGDSPKMDQYTQRADQQIGRVWEAVKARMAHNQEEWMLVVTTDHGRSAETGHHHGGQSEREKTIWMATNQTPNNTFSSDRLSMVDIYPSICRFMSFDLPHKVAYELEGVSFIEAVDISDPKVIMKDDQIELSWKSYDDGATVEIYCALTDHYKEGGTDQWEKVGEITAGGEQVFVFDCSKKPSNFYKFSLRTKRNSVPVILDLTKKVDEKQNKPV